MSTVKIAVKWNDQTLEFQREYLKKHPGSKRKLTAKPSPTVDKSLSQQKLNAIMHAAIASGNSELFVKALKHSDAKAAVKKLHYAYTGASKSFVEDTFPQVYSKLHKFFEIYPSLIADACLKSRDLGKKYKKDIEELYNMWKDTGFGDEFKRILKRQDHEFAPKAKIDDLKDEFLNIIKKYDKNATVGQVPSRHGPFGHGPQLRWIPSMLESAHADLADDNKVDRAAVKKGQKLVKKVINKVFDFADKYDNVNVSYDDRMSKHFNGPFMTNVPRITLDVG
jgi:hypothetical protein